MAHPATSRALRSHPLSDDLLGGADAVVVVTDHSSFDAERIYRLSQLLVDARNMTAEVGESKRTAHPQRWVVRGMRIAVVGSGYVGLTTGACLAESGNDVICVDRLEERIERLKGGRPPLLRTRSGRPRS